MTSPEQFAAARRNLSDQLVTALLALFANLGSWHKSDQDAFLAQAVPMVRGSQLALASITAAWITQQASATTGRAVAPPALREDAATNLRKGVDDTDVYRRPFTEIYTALSKGTALPDAVELGRVRLQEIAELDLQQTYAVSSRAAMDALPGAARPRYWRRVLTGPGSCALCVVASTLRYTRSDLNPIHPGCDCTVDPLWGKVPELVIEPDRLEAAHAAVQELTGSSDRGARAPDYRKVMISVVQDHGEVGPMLTRPKDHFTGPDDITPGTPPGQ